MNSTKRTIEYLSALLAVMSACNVSSFGADTIPNPKTFSENKRALTAADLQFGEKQVAQLVCDRPGLSNMMTKGDPIWNWAVRQFAGESTKCRFYWSSEEMADRPSNGYAQSCFGHAMPICIQIRQTGTDGQPLSPEMLLRCLVFECFNIRHGSSFDKFAKAAMRLSKEQFIEQLVKAEFQAYQQSADFFKQLLLPMAEERHLDLHPSLWGVGGPVTFEAWLEQYTDHSSYPWSTYGSYYADLKEGELNYRKFRTAFGLWETDAEWYKPGGRRYNHDGIEAFKRTNYGAARQYFSKALKVATASAPPDSELGKILNNLGFVYETQGDYGQAEALYKHALKTNRKVFGPNQPEEWRSLVQLTYFYLDQSRYAEAEPLARRALDIRESEPGQQRTYLRASLNRLAVIESNLGKYAEAENLIKRASEIEKEELSGPIWTVVR